MTLHRTRLWWRRALGLVATAAAAGFLLLVVAAPAGAHASLLSTDPVDGAVLQASPGTARLVYDERVSLPGDSVTLYDARGRTLPSSTTARGSEVTVDLPDELAQGSYVLLWRVVSADGHPISGSVTFAIGRPSDSIVTPTSPTAPASTDVLLGMLQGVQLGALLLAAGLVVFSLTGLPSHALAGDVRRRIQRILRWAVPVGAAAALAVVPVSGALQTGGGPRAVFSSDVWNGDLLRDQALASVVVVLGLLVMLLGHHRLLAGGAGTAWWPAAAGAALGLVGPALVGHTRAIEPTSAMVLADILHVSAGAVWLGGLTGLAVALPILSRRDGLAAEVLARFSSVAAGVLLATAAAGVLLAWRIVPGWAELTGTAYGRVLLVKIGVVALAVLLGAGNRYVLLPRVRAAIGHDHVRRAARATRRTVAVEACLLVVVVALTGFLIDRSPRTEVAVPEGRTGAATAVVGDHRIVATLTPGRIGPGVLQVQVQDLAGEPVELAEEPAVIVRGPVGALGEVRLESVDLGTWAANLVLPAAGTWKVQVSLRISEFESPVTSLEFAVR